MIFISEHAVVTGIYISVEVVLMIVLYTIINRLSITMIFVSVNTLWLLVLVYLLK